MIKCKKACPYEKFEGCCHVCPEENAYDIVCGDNNADCGQALFDEESAVQAFKTEQVAVMRQITELLCAKKKIDEQEKILKDKLKEAMEKYNIKKFENDVLKITYVAETMTTIIDNAKLKKKYPEIVDECSKTSKKSAYIKIERNGEVG